MADCISVTTMGMFDSIWVDCPLCKLENGLEFQSKGAEEPMLTSYTLENAPIEVLLEAGVRYEVRCKGCRKRFHLEFDISFHATRGGKQMMDGAWVEDKSARRIVCDDW